MIFRLAHAAIEDLEAIDDYTVRAWDAGQADRYLAMLWSTFERIACAQSFIQTVAFVWRADTPSYFE